MKRGRAGDGACTAGARSDGQRYGLGWSESDLVWSGGDWSHGLSLLLLLLVLGVC